MDYCVDVRLQTRGSQENGVDVRLQTRGTQVDQHTIVEAQAPDAGTESVTAEGLSSLSPAEAIALLIKHAPALDEDSVAGALNWLVLHPLEVKVGWNRYSTAVRGLLDRLFQLASMTATCAPPFLTPFAKDAIECLESGRPIAAAALAAATTAMACAAHGAAAPKLMRCVADILSAVSKRTHELTAEELVAAATAGAAVDCSSGSGCPELLVPVRELARVSAERARELRGSVLADAAWTLARLEAAGIVPARSLTSLVAERLDAPSMLDLEPPEISRLALVLADSHVQNPCAALALAIAVRCHAQMVDGFTAWSSLELLALTRAIGEMAPGSRDVAFHLSDAVAKCSDSLSPAIAADFSCVFATCNLQLDVNVAQSLATQLFKGVDLGVPITGEWANALDVLEEHAKCFKGWRELVAQIDDVLRLPALDTLQAAAGRRSSSSRPSRNSVKAACEDFKRLPVQNIGAVSTRWLLEELDVLATVDEPWIQVSRDVGSTVDLEIPLERSSVAIVHFEFAGFLAAGIGGAEEPFSVPWTQHALVRNLTGKGSSRKDDLVECLSLLNIDRGICNVCAGLAALYEALSALLVAAASGAPDAEWRLVSGGSDTSTSGESSAACQGLEDRAEEFLLLAPHGFPCAMTELRVFRPQHVAGHIRLLCLGRPPHAETLLLTAQLKRLLPHVSLSIAVDTPSTIPPLPADTSPYLAEQIEPEQPVSPPMNMRPADPAYAQPVALPSIDTVVASRREVAPGTVTRSPYIVKGQGFLTPGIAAPSLCAPTRQGLPTAASRSLPTAAAPMTMARVLSIKAAPQGREPIQPSQQRLTRTLEQQLFFVGPLGASGVRGA